MFEVSQYLRDAIIKKELVIFVGSGLLKTAYRSY
jgi:hypothetical protein